MKRKKKRQTAYMQLYEQLRDDIAGGVYVYGERLPSKRVTAEEAGISLVTAEHAYALLCEEGYAEARERQGYFVIYREDDLYGAEAERTEPVSGAGEEEVFAVDGSFPFSVYARTVRRVLSEEGEAIFYRPEARGSLRLRRAIASYLARSRGIRVRAEQIVIGAGSEYLYSIIAQLFPQEKQIAIESPSYEKIRSVYTAQGKRCEELRLGRDGILSSELKRAKARILHVTPFHSYPSGITASAGKCAEYVSWASARDGLLIEDDFDSEFTVSKKAKDTVYALSADGRVIYMNTFHKTIAPSMRVGYMVLPERMLAVYERELSFSSCTVPVLEQYVLAALLDGGDFERHINRMRRRIRRGGA